MLFLQLFPFLQSNLSWIFPGLWEYHGKSIRIIILSNLSISISPCVTPHHIICKSTKFSEKKKNALPFPQVSQVRWMDASEIEGHLQHHEWRFQDDQAAWPFFRFRDAHHWIEKTLYKYVPRTGDFSKTGGMYDNIMITTPQLVKFEEMAISA